MEQFYTCFIATTELLTCRAIFNYGTQHDLTLEVGKEEVITFSLPNNLGITEQGDICLGFNPEMIEINSATVERQSNRFYSHTYLRVTLTARDIGSTKIGVTTPYRAAASSLKTFLLPVIKKPQLA